MVRVFVEHRVADYNRWRKVFDDHASTRKKHGEISAGVFRSAEDPNKLLMEFEWDNTQNAHGFANSPELRETMIAAGVIEEPKWYIVEK